MEFYSIRTIGINSLVIQFAYKCLRIRFYVNPRNFCSKVCMYVRIIVNIFQKWDHLYNQAPYYNLYAYMQFIFIFIINITYFCHLSYHGNYLRICMWKCGCADTYTENDGMIIVDCVSEYMCTVCSKISFIGYSQILH